MAANGVNAFSARFRVLPLCVAPISGRCVVISSLHTLRTSLGTVRPHRSVPDAVSVPVLASASRASGTFTLRRCRRGPRSARTRSEGRRQGRVQHIVPRINSDPAVAPPLLGEMKYDLPIGGRKPRQERLTSSRAARYGVSGERRCWVLMETTPAARRGRRQKLNAGAGRRGPQGPRELPSATRESMVTAWSVCDRLGIDLPA